MLVTRFRRWCCTCSWRGRASGGGVAGAGAGGGGSSVRVVATAVPECPYDTLMHPKPGTITNLKELHRRGLWPRSVDSSNGLHSGTCTSVIWKILATKLTQTGTQQEHNMKLMPDSRKLTWGMAHVDSWSLILSRVVPQVSSIHFI